MTSPHLAVINPRNVQRGVAAVEFALVAILFFLLLLGVMEFGRLLYVWNTVQEVTRNAARQAVVTDFTKTVAIDAIKRAAVFGSDDGHLPASPEVTDAKVVIRYLYAIEADGTGKKVAPMPLSPGDNIAACITPSRNTSCIRFVEVCVSIGVSTEETCPTEPSISFVPMIGLFSQFADLKIPLSTVRMPAESLGFRP